MYGFAHEGLIASFAEHKQQLKRLEGMKEDYAERHDIIRLDLIDHLHAQLINSNQHKIEHEGLEYWLRQTPITYDPLLQHYYLETGNSFFREDYAEMMARHPRAESSLVSFRQ